MIELLFEILPFAIGIAVSPVPIITVILSLFSIKAKWNGPAFLLGWAIGILVVCVPVLVFADAGHFKTETGPSQFASWVRIFLGLLLFAVAIRNWIRRPKTPEEVKMPKWLKMIEVISPVKVFGVGFFFAVVTNPKNFALTVAATLPIAHSMYSPLLKAVLVTVFVLISCIGVGVPVVYYLVAGESARKLLNSWKSWLVFHNSAVMAVLFLVFGTILISQGISGGF